MHVGCVHVHMRQVPKPWIFNNSDHVEPFLGRQNEHSGPLTFSDKPAYKCPPYQHTTSGTYWERCRFYTQLQHASEKWEAHSTEKPQVSAPCYTGQRWCRHAFVCWDEMMHPFMDLQTVGNSPSHAWIWILLIDRGHTRGRELCRLCCICCCP